jgi:hypothetical protein
MNPAMSECLMHKKEEMHNYCAFVGGDGFWLYIFARTRYGEGKGRAVIKAHKNGENRQSAGKNYLAANNDQCEGQAGVQGGAEVIVAPVAQKPQFPSPGID